jgi:hypothetical protein
MLDIEQRYEFKIEVAYRTTHVFFIINFYNYTPIHEGYTILRPYFVFCFLMEVFLFLYHGNIYIIRKKFFLFITLINDLKCNYGLVIFYYYFFNF